jgi:hypothetical protein
MKQSGFSEKLTVQDSWARLGGLSSTYYDIAEAAYDEFLAEEESPIPTPEPDEDPTDVTEQEARLRIAGVKTIVFSAMCIEAAAFDFSAIQLGDSYAEQFLDKLDIVSKWVVVPRLVAAKSLREDGPALNALRVLVRARNALVHQKSLPYDPDGRNLALVAKTSDAFPGNVHNAFKAVVLLSLELNEVLEVPSVGLPPFEKHVRSFRQPPTRVKKVIQRCRVINRGLS